MLSKLLPLGNAASWGIPASKSTYPQHKKNPNDFVYGSWRFHHYFDGLKVKPKGIPPILIRPERIYVETDVEVNRKIYKRQKIDVIMDLRV
jgi:hypothetical protein